MNQRRIVFSLVAVILASFVHFWPDFQAANESIRFYFVESVVDHHSLSIDPILEQYGVKNVDMARFEGRAYLDKAPGLSIAVMPLYFVLTRCGMSPEPETAHHLHYLLLLFGVLLPAMLAIGWTRELVLEATGQEEAAWLAALSLGLATPFALYATLFFSHTPAAALAVGSYYYLRRRRSAVAGALAGAMVLVDTPTAVLALVLGVLCGLRDKRWESVVAFGLCGLAFVAIQFGYNAWIFGGPLTFAYSAKATGVLAEIHDKGLYGFQIPTWESLSGLTFGEQRGLFFHAPVLVLSLVGVRRLNNPQWRELASVCLVYFLWISAFVDWPAGDTYGPRHLIPIMPFLAVGVGLAVASGPALLRRLAPGLILASVVMTWVPLVTFPYALQAFDAPVFELGFPLLFEGHLSPSLGSWLGVASPWSLLLPIGLSAGLLWQLKPSKEMLALALAGLLLLGLMAQGDRPDTPKKRLSRIGVEATLGYKETAEDLSKKFRAELRRRNQK